MESKRVVVAIVLFAALFAFGCITPPWPQPTPTPGVTASPTPIPSPTPSVAVAGVTKFASEQEFRDFLAEGTQETFGVSVTRGITEAVPLVALVMAQAGAAAGAEATKALPERVSETNVQVAGIDEPDIVKTDGLNIYVSREPTWFYWFGGPWRGPMIEEIAPAREGMPVYVRPSTRVVRAFPPSDLSEASRINDTGNLLIDRNKSVLVMLAGDSIQGYSINAGEANAELKWSLGLNESRIADARYFDGKVYAVIVKSVNNYRPCPIPLASRGGFEISVPCVEIYRPREVIPVDVTFHVLVISPEDGSISRSVSFVGSSESSILYMSNDALFIAYKKQASVSKILSSFYLNEARDLLPASVVEKLAKVSGYDLSDGAKLLEFQTIIEQYSASLSEEDRLKLENDMQNRLTQYMDNNARSLESTEIVKVGISDFAVKATGVVPGHLLNQFSLDEYNSHLRVATTVGRWDKSFNDLYVLDDGMQKTGEVLDFGKGERIYSARFLGDRGYVVTFKETDPFFVFDLSNPSSPALKGELKIPGYSAYLHPLAEHVVLGVGKEENKVKASIYDVSDASQPKELAKYVLAESWSDITRTHHAFLQDAKHQVFFLPGSQGGYVLSYYKDGAYALNLEAAVPVENALRALYLDDFLYVVSNNEVAALDENTWKTVKELELEYP
jgi:uncharacterized secreted protein with C-terminal beta-propeller domain